MLIWDLFEFVLRRGLIVQRRFHFCWAGLTWCQGISLHPTREETQNTQEAGGQHSQASWPWLTKRIFQATWHHAQLIKLEEEGGRGRHWEWQCLSSQATVTCDGAWHSWRWLNTYLPMVSDKCVPCFVFFICMAFILSIKLPLTQPTSFFTFMLLILSPIPPGVIEHVVWCLVINWG